MQEKYNNLYEKLVALKQKVDNNEISMDSLSNVEIAALSLMYEIEIMNLDEKLAIDEAQLNGYKIRFANAIEYLKKKKNFEL